MVIPQKPILIIALFCSILSCGNIEGEQQKSTKDNRVQPASQDKKTELPTTKPQRSKPAETPIKKDEEKKRFTKLDTLKPVTVIP